MSESSANAQNLAATEPVKIQEDRDGERRFLLHPENDDLFVRTGKQVIDACRLGISVELWLQELRGMFSDVAKWATERKQKIRGCYASPRAARVTLFFIPTAEQFDFDLADELTELNTRLVKQFNIGMIETHQIPWAEWDRFLDPESARAIYGDVLPAHHSVDP